MTVTLFTGVFALAGGFYFHKKGPRPYRGKPLLACDGTGSGRELYAFCQSALERADAPCPFYRAGLLVLCAAGARIGRGSFFLSDLFNGFLALPLFNYTREWHTFKKMGSGSSTGHA